MTEVAPSGNDAAEQPAATAPDPVEAGVADDSDTPGSVLRRTREARGQSIADVVQVIRFSARQIEALERDDYAALPGATAVRGLVRNYAKFLKLDAGPLLAQLDPAVPVPESDVRPPANIGEAEVLPISERVPTRPLVLGGAAVILALMALWYLGSSGNDVLTRLLGADDLPPATKGGANAASAVAPLPTPMPAAAPAAVPADPPVAPEVTAVGLRVEFDDRSWIEIRDATQRVVFVGEYPAGTRQNVDGKPPYQVWIGKASGVRLFLGERSIDLKPHTREEVARLTLE